MLVVLVVMDYCLNLSTIEDIFIVAVVMCACLVGGGQVHDRVFYVSLYVSSHMS
jgi:hypothetical protein